MPDDLTVVAQYAKSNRDTPSEVYNAACRLLDADPNLTAKVSGALYRSAEADIDSVIAELTALDAEMNEFEQQHNPDCECDTFHATHEAVRRIRVALNGPESHRDGRTPRTLGTAGQEGAREAQEAGE